MISSISVIVIAVIVIVIFLITVSSIVFVYKLINSFIQKNIRYIFEKYSKQVYEIITGKKGEYYFDNFYILADVIYTNYSWIDGEEKERLYNTLKKVSFFDFAIKKIQKGRRSEKLKFSKVLSIVGKEDEINQLLKVSIKEPYLIDFTAEAIFKNLDAITHFDVFKPYIEVLFLNLDKYHTSTRRRIEFFAIYGAERIKEVIYKVVTKSNSEKLLVSCLNILSEIATMDDLKNIEFLIDHPSPEVRAAFCKMLEKTGCIECVRKLKEIIEKEEVNFVRLRALRALSNISPKDSLKYLFSALEDNWFYMRDFAAKMLSKFGPIVLEDILKFYNSTQDKFAKDKIIEIFYVPEIFDYVIKSYLNYRTNYERNLAKEIIDILCKSNSYCFNQRLENEGYKDLIKSTIIEGCV